MALISANVTLLSPTPYVHVTFLPTFATTRYVTRIWQSLKKRCKTTVSFPQQVYCFKIVLKVKVSKLLILLDVVRLILCVKLCVKEIAYENLDVNFSMKTHLLIESCSCDSQNKASEPHRIFGVGERSLACARPIPHLINTYISSFWFNY